MVLQTTQGPKRPDPAFGRQCVRTIVSIHESQLVGTYIITKYMEQ